MASSSAAPAPAGVAMKEEYSFARSLRVKFRPEASMALYTPFIVCLAAGNLDQAVFQHFNSQEVHFLRASEQAYELAEKHTDEDDAKTEISELRRFVKKELEDLGSHPTLEIEPTPATAKYTKFLLDTARGHVEAVKVVDKFVTPYEKTKLSPYTIGAMTSCICLYAYLGQELEMYLRGGEEKGHAYKNWVDTLASKSFQASAVELEELLDKLCLALTLEEHKVTEEIYHQALKLQIDFLSSQPVVQQTAFPLTRLYDPAVGLIIFSGFDLTCTVRDSAAILAEITIQMARKAGDIEDQNSTAQKSLSEKKASDIEDASSITQKSSSEQEVPKTDDTEDGNLIPQRSSLVMKNSWQAIQREYTEEYNKLIERAPRVDPFNYDAVYNGLEAISNFEKLANMKVFKSGLLRGINLNVIKSVGERMVLQDGCADFFQRVIKKKNELNAEIHIISYCWCSDLIRSSPVGSLGEVTIHSNDFFYEKDISTGVYTSRMESPMDKLEVMKKFWKKCSSQRKPLSVYIGDTVGDLLGLLAVDVGIVIGESVSLRELGEKFGVSFNPLQSSLIHKQMVVDEKGSSIWKGKRSGILYTVSTWSEIAAFILGLQA